MNITIITGIHALLSNNYNYYYMTNRNGTKN